MAFSSMLENLVELMEMQYVEQLHYLMFYTIFSIGDRSIRTQHKTQHRNEEQKLVEKKTTKNKQIEMNVYIG